jgi:LacI family transcriptional regulator
MADSKHPGGVRVTQRDIAREAGVSHVTVSLALRDRREIPLRTRRRIREIARKMGYLPDPMLHALSAYRLKYRTPTFKANLAWINSYPQPGDLYGSEDFRCYHQGAKERAGELGYGIEDVRLADYGFRFPSVERMLEARGIRCLLLAPGPVHGAALRFTWSRFTVVRFGYSLGRPAMHTVTNAQYRTSFACVENLVKRGYRRIGYVTRRSSEERNDSNFLSGYLAASYQLRLEPMPVLELEDVSNEGHFEPMREWLAAWRPDAVVSLQPGVYHTLLAWKVRIPGDVAFAFLAVPAKDPLFSGMYQNPRVIGRRAVDLLVSSYERQEKGLPRVPVHLLIESSWRQGRTTRSRSPRKAPAKGAVPARQA